MPETPLPNDPASRSPDGQIKDQQNPQLTNPQDPPKNPDGTLKAQSDALSPEELAAAEAKKAESKDKSLLNDDKATGAPEKYEPFKVPEGFTLDETVATEAGTLFKELNLSQEAGQKLIDMYAAKTSEAAEAPYKAYTDMRKEWRDTINADPEIGHKIPEVKTTISRAIDAMGDPKLAQDFRSAMDLTGAGDNPAFIKAFYKLAQLVGEGKPVSGKGPSPHGQGNQAAPPSVAGAMYPNLK